MTEHKLSERSSAIKTTRVSNRLASARWSLFVQTRRAFCFASTASIDKRVDLLAEYRFQQLRRTAEIRSENFPSNEPTRVEGPALKCSALTTRWFQTMGQKSEELCFSKRNLFHNVATPIRLFRALHVMRRARHKVLLPARRVDPECEPSRSGDERKDRRNRQWTGQTNWSFFF